MLLPVLVYLMGFITIRVKPMGKSCLFLMFLLWPRFRTPSWGTSAILLPMLIVSPVTRKGWKFELSRPPWYAKKVLFLAAILFVLQDVLIDPVSLRGSEWFLGQIYYYSENGVYFGVPLSNFLGWFLVGLAIIYCFQKLDYKMDWSKEIAGNALMGPVLYFLNMIFILSVTFYIGEYFIGMISLSIFSILVFLTILKVRDVFPIRTNR